VLQDPLFTASLTGVALDKCTAEVAANGLTFTPLGD
jgi:hypothetical protein